MATERLMARTTGRRRVPGGGRDDRAPTAGRRQASGSTTQCSIDLRKRRDCVHTRYDQHLWLPPGTLFKTEI
jgi:hypothetical protein